MNRAAVGWAVIALRVVIGGIAVEKAVGDDLVDALGLPESVGGGLGGGRNGDEGCRKEKAHGGGTRQAFGTMIQSGCILAATRRCIKLKGSGRSPFGRSLGGQVNRPGVILGPVYVQLQPGIIQLAKGDLLVL